MMNISIKISLFCACVILCSCVDQPYLAGERLYRVNCANCHLDDGKGLGALIPPLAGADYLSENRALLPCILRNGLAGDSIRVNGQWYAEKMPGVHHLSEADITNILNYINTSWGNKEPIYRLDEVLESLKTCPKRINSEY
jgi:mono/diheme cytochrome c family protein